jgi:hypothetical protein
MPVIIYIASIAVVLLACSVWAKKSSELPERGFAAQPCALERQKGDGGVRIITMRLSEGIVKAT